ncbi:MAG: helix-turn-helix domain-containing protein [Myxococcota bacterium]
MYTPPPDLADVVERFWTGAWDLRGQAPHVTEHLGDPTIHLAFEGDDRRIVGVWTHLWRREFEGVGVVRAVKLRCGAARAFLPGSASGLTDRIVSVDSVLGDTRDLAAAVLGAEDEIDGFAVLADWLRARRRDDPEVPRAVAAIEHIREGSVDGSLTRVDALADRMGCTVRALQRLFRSHVGASPKWALRWFRLQEVAVRVERGGVDDLAELAYALGYADQAHLARDFRAATGRTLRGFEDTVNR